MRVITEVTSLISIKCRRWMKWLKYSGCKFERHMSRLYLTSGDATECKKWNCDWDGTNCGCLLSRVPKFMDPGSLDNPFIRNLLFFDISVINSLRLLHWEKITFVWLVGHNLELCFCGASCRLIQWDSRQTINIITACWEQTKGAHAPHVQPL